MKLLSEEDPLSGGSGGRGSILWTSVKKQKDPRRLVPGAQQQLVQAALQAVLVVVAFAQREDAGGGVPADVGVVRAAQNHGEAAGASRPPAALRHAVSVAGQVRQQQHQDQHQDFLLGNRVQIHSPLGSGTPVGSRSDPRGAALTRDPSVQSHMHWLICTTLQQAPRCGSAGSGGVVADRPFLGDAVRSSRRPLMLALELQLELG
ncbi:hypothetical protein EYF80_037011 [Liparis tanakae]|uniref:Uncharacterized protein n=1 Tax=Liparis tanakae TaxID=230148 RepID=A0A4Z2GGV7_9TELE|nr:hypothetical protein EYF80_037011 [Liparis tanakae]